MTAAVTERDLETWREIAREDENEGPLEHRIAVITARGRLAARGEHLYLGHRSPLLGTRARVAMTLEHVDPVGFIADRYAEAVARCGDPDEDKDEGGHVLDNPPGRP
jgi:hypothetical protein